MSSANSFTSSLPIWITLIYFSCLIAVKLSYKFFPSKIFLIFSVSFLKLLLCSLFLLLSSVSIFRTICLNSLTSKIVFPFIFFLFLYFENYSLFHHFSWLSVFVCMYYVKQFISFFLKWMGLCRSWNLWLNRALVLLVPL